MGQHCSCDVQEQPPHQEFVPKAECNGADNDPDATSNEDLSTTLPSTRTIPYSVANEDICDTTDQPQDSEAVEPLKKHCQLGEVSEAIQMFDDLEQQAKKDGNRQLLSVLHGPALASLREICRRRAGFIERLVEPAWKDHSEWTFLNLSDPEIDPNFKLTFRMRFARGNERNHAKGGTQIMIGAHATGFPVNLTQLVAYHSRVNHLRKELIKDCEKIYGKPASNQNLYTAILASLMAPRVLPFKLEDKIIRNFILCKEAPPIPGSRPGIMVLESSPDDELTHYDGLELPVPRRGVIQITGSEKLNYFMPSLIGPNHIDAISSMRVQLPVPQWLISIELVKRFLADVFTNTLRTIKDQVCSNWDDLPFNADIEADPAFFGKLQEIIDASTAELCKRDRKSVV